MSQSNPIQLPVSILSSLYKDVLVEDRSVKKEETATTTVPKTTPPTPAKKDTVVCVHYATAVLSAGHAALLQGILKACRLEDQQVELITVTNTLNLEPVKILEQYGATRAILFGLEPADLSLPVHFPPFQIQLFNKVKYLFVPALGKIEQDKTLKMQLWKCLQQLYPI